MFFTKILQSKWMICLLCVIPVLVLFAIASAIVLGLIPVFLPEAGSDIQYRGNWIESASFAYDLPNNLSSQTVVIRDGNLMTNDTSILQQIFKNQLASDTSTKNINIEIKKAIATKISNKQLQETSRIMDNTPKQSIKPRSSSNETYIHLSTSETNQPKDTIYQLLIDMNLLFPITCLQRCRQSAMNYIVNGLFANIYLDKNLYTSIFVNTTVQQTTMSSSTAAATATTTTTQTVTMSSSTSTTTQTVTTDTTNNCLPNNSSDVSPTTVSLFNADELKFNDPNQTLILQFSCPILDIYNYSINVNGAPIINTTNTTSNITILDRFTNEQVLLSFAGLDIYGLPIFTSFELYYGSISMPVQLLFSNKTVAVGVLVQANLTDYPSVSQTGYTDANGTVIFTNVPSRTISLFARTENNEIAIQGLAPISSGVTLTLIPFGDNTSNSTLNYQSLSVPNSKKQFLRIMTKRDLELPGFTVTTSGLGLRMISKIFKTEANSTSVYVRYKFITAEVPGGYFGSIFNDYFSVTIRSEKGTYKSISRSMNALGLGAFDYASGATDWYVIKLKLSGEPELIQVDVGVANVGDGLYQSSVFVDKIGIEKCDKCDTCDNCPSTPMCRTTCTNPPQKSCLFYTDCMEATVSCGASGYALGYGAKYCQKYTDRLKLFSTDGQNWIYKTMNCLQKALVAPLQDCNSNCQGLRTTAFDSHPKCYMDSGVCSLPVMDFWYILTTVKGDLFTLAGLKQGFITSGGCVQSIIVKIDDAIAQATHIYVIIPLITLRKYFESLLSNNK